MGVDNSDFEYMAHCRGNTQKDMFYVGAYLGSELNGKLRSLSGKSPAANKNHSSWNTLAKSQGIPDGNGGSGYDMWGFYQLTFMQCMYVLKYKNLNSQTTVGMGAVSTSITATGGTETKGMDWGTTDTTQHVKLFGIEDFWGNMWQAMGGFWCSSNRNIYTATENLNNNGSGYTDRGTSGVTSDVGYSWGTKRIGTTHGGFITINTSNGSATTYYCDYGQLVSSRPLRYGGGYNANTSSGIFYMDMADPENGTYNYVNSRIMYV